MRPYLAIIKDSFREAMASRVLWLLLVMITAVLLSVAPLGFREQLTTGLAQDDVINWGALATRITTVGQKDEPSPERRIWQLLDTSLQQKLLDLQKPLEENIDRERIQVRLRNMQGTLIELAVAIREILRREDFYDPPSWKNVQLRDEAQELLSKGIDQLAEDELGRLNRLLLEAAFRDLLTVSPPRSLVLTYAGRDFSGPLAIRREQFDANLESWISWFLKWGFGVGGIFVAILVTAPIIPQTLEPGSLNLLLSKPVHRWLLFLAKFVGGCAFILLSTAYLVAGFWLIFGLRMGIWNHKLLLYIPCFLFIFAIYYSVSALAGLVWRSTVVCVVVSILFWAMCFSVGTAKWGVESVLINPMRIKTLLPAGKELFSVNEVGLVQRWREDEQNWEPVFQSAEEIENPFRATRVAVGPIYDSRREMLISIQGGGFRGQDLTLSVAQSSDRWRRKAGALAPLGTLALLEEPSGDIVAISVLGIFRLTGDPAVPPQLPDEAMSPQSAESDSPDVSDSSDLSDQQEPESPVSPFIAAGPETPWNIDPPWDFAIHRESGVLAVYSRGKITLYKPNGQGVYVQQTEKYLDGDEEEAAALAYGGPLLMVAREDGSILTLDADSLDLRERYQLEGKNRPRFITASPGGRWFAIVFHNGKLYLLDTQDGTMSRPQVSGQGDISAAAYSGQHRLLVADQGTRVSQYRLAPLERDQRYSPQLSLMEKTYRYGILPIYTIFPKPGELDKTIQYIMTGEETRASMLNTGELSDVRVQLRPWAPVWSGLVFIAAILALSCLYIERQEF